MKPTVIFKGVTKQYRLYKKNTHKLLDVIIPNGFGEEFYALQNINFIAKEGDVVGIIGVNGAGKSTLSNLITGVIPPTLGNITIRGQASLIAIASGLNNQLTGRENIELKCLMLGYSKKEIKDLQPSIIEFADIGKFIDQPVKSYSSGMKSRLGFAISVNVDPDILVIDEALSVGDQTFADKCFKKMLEFKQKGKTIFFISHSIGQIRKFCGKIMWLEGGEIKEYGSVEDVLPKYESFLMKFKAMTKEEKESFNEIININRSKLKYVPIVTDLKRNQSRKDRRKRRGLFRNVTKLLLILGLILISIFASSFLWERYIYPLNNKEIGTTSVNLKKVENIDEDVIEDKSKSDIADIRYVVDSNVYIRKTTNEISEPITMALFGQPLVIKKINSTYSLVEVPFNNQVGWVNNNSLKKITAELNDEEIASKIDQLIGFTPSLSEALPMIGVHKDTAKLFKYTKYHYLGDQVVGFTITVNDSSKGDVISVLGIPQLENTANIFYTGEKYDFLMTIYNEEIRDIIVTRRVQKES